VKATEPATVVAKPTMLADRFVEYRIKLHFIFLKSKVTDHSSSYLPPAWSEVN